MNAPDRPNANLVSLLWAGPEAASEIAAMHGRLFDQPWDASGVTRLLEHPGSTALIARHGFPKTSVGFVVGQIAADEAELLSIGVIESWQRLGLGSRLLLGLTRALERAQVRRIHLEVAADNTAAVALYEAHGFSRSGLRKNYYQRAGGPSVDALTLSRAL
jgi:ribosomal-protein-alanine N-acetyltransferase